MTVPARPPMSDAAAPSAGASARLYAMAVFFSAALVFLVEPMIAKLVLPQLGGSTAVWNTSLAFFQAALLAGYLYAHLLQRISSLKVQMAVHLGVLAAGALVLPLRIVDLLGAPSNAHPALWLLGTLAVSVGPPFAALSATAPLLQAWFARTHATRPAGPDPYRLYAASNTGSLLALLAYPVLAEPLLHLHVQQLAWSLGYGLFAILAAVLAIQSRSGWEALPPASSDTAASVSWSERLIWLLLAAAPSSLLLGVTNHITADVASAPFLWVVPLALYLLSFIVAFQAKPMIRPSYALGLQACFTPVALISLCLLSAPWMLQLSVHLIAFFLTALICAQALAARRPAHARLTEFYLLMSLGGVIGGAFNAFLAPLMFNNVWEYPIVLVLAGLARPWGRGGLTVFQAGWLISAVIAVTVLLAGFTPTATNLVILLSVPALAAISLRDRAAIHVGVLAALALVASLQVMRPGAHTYRSFFGVVQIALTRTPDLGPMRLMVHGTTLHGSQSLDPAKRCIPTTYYGPGTPIGQTLRLEQARKSALNIGAVGLGAGTVAAYVRATDQLRFFEIDPLVVRLALDPRKFSFVHGCAKGPVAVTLGDARLSLARMAPGQFDVLLVDAFSGDSVPTHLLTAEAMRLYLRLIKPDGVVILHLSNRNLELRGPTAAALRLAGGAAVEQAYASPAPSVYEETSSIAMVAARSPSVLQPYLASGQWIQPSQRAGAWTDDYTNVFGALVTRLREGGRM